MLLGMDLQTELALFVQLISTVQTPLVFLAGALRLLPPDLPVLQPVSLLSTF